MISIKKASFTDAALIARIAEKTFRETHETGVPAASIESYVSVKYSVNAIEEELNDAANIYHIIYYNDLPAGYSKMILNKPYPAIERNDVTKLDRIYLLKEFYRLKLGSALFQFITSLSKEANQTGMWLYVWKINDRAIQFYTNAGFKAIASEDFKISETHSNPNHIMYLEY